MARVRGIKQPHPLGSVASRAGVQQLTAASGGTISSGGVKISALPAASAANDIDQFEVNQAGTSRRVTLDQMAALVGTVTLADDIYSYGADGAGGATDLAALDAMLATQVDDLPRLHVWAKTSIDVGSLIPGSDTVDPMPYLQRIFAAFDTPALQGRHFIFGRQRAWNFQTRPSTGLGPQSQYLTPPQRCTLEWQREWDFTAYPASTAPTFVRRQASYGPTIAVVGDLVKGQRTITVTAGGASGLVYGQRLLLRATTLLDTLVGAWTLADNTPASGFSARAEDLIVKSVSGDIITFEGYLQDNYPSTTTPVLQTYIDEPEIRLINPTAIGPGWNGGAQSDRLFDIRRGRNFIVEGGRISNFAQPLKTNGSLGGAFRDVQIFGILEGGNPGGGISLNDGTSNFLVENCTTWGGSQMFMLSSQGDAYGVMRDVTFRDCTVNGSQNGFSTHNTHERISWHNCRVNNSTGSAFDVRVPNCTLINCSAFNVNGGVLLRPSANNCVIDGFRIDKALHGIRFQDDATEVDYNPSNITVRNCLLERIGGVGSQGALRFDYPNNTAGVFPVLGPLTITGNTITMSDSSVPIAVKGKWTAPVIANNSVGPADGFVPGAVAAIQLTFPTGGSSVDNPSNPTVIGNTRTSTYNAAIVGGTGIARQAQSGVVGTTAAGPVTLTTATTLIASQTGQVFVNTGATALVAVTLPASEITSRQVYEFYVTDADGFNIIGPASGLRIGSGALGTSMSATAIGAWARLTRVTSTLWIAEVDATANWTLV